MVESCSIGACLPCVGVIAVDKSFTVALPSDISLLSMQPVDESHSTAINLMNFVTQQSFKDYAEKCFLGVAVTFINEVK